MNASALAALSSSAREAAPVTVRRVEGSRDLTAFIGLPHRLFVGDPNWVAPLDREVRELLDPRRNPWFEHAEAALFLAVRGGRVVGRISAQVDRLVQEHMGTGTGQWGFFDLENDPLVAAALFDAAENWLLGRGMTRALGPFSLSIWDEPGLLVQGFHQPPTVMMGHALPYVSTHVEARGYVGVKDLLTYELSIDIQFPPVVRRIIANGDKNPRLVVRETRMDHYDEDSGVILDILNDAWAGNWGFTPLTRAESLYAGKKMRRLVKPDLVRIAELDGVPVAFMFTLPNLNEVTQSFRGRLFPFNVFKLLRAIRRPRTRRIRVPLMGVRRAFQGTRNASLLAFMMIEVTRRVASTKYGSHGAEIGWILEDNSAMRTIAEAIDSRVNKIYRIYERPL